MDFQETFLALFWPVWVRMLGVFVAGVAITAVYWMLAQSTSYRTPQQVTHRFAGLLDREEERR